MTSLSENDNKNEINIESKQCTSENEQSSLHNDDSQSITTVKRESTTNSSIDNDQKQEELITTDEKEQSNNSTLEIEEKDLFNGTNNDDTLTKTSPSIVGTDEEQQTEATETTVNNDEDENRSEKPLNSKVEYSPTPYNRPPYYTNGHPYGPAPYYYYHPSSIEKPAPLMFIPTQAPPPAPPSSPSPSSRDNQTGNSTTISSQNLPPRLRQTSLTDNDSNSQAPSAAPQPMAPTINGRRHRSILPRGTSTYYSPHPPPPLMATPPGVLYPYPPPVHQSGHIAYNIRSPDELELLAFQHQLMNLQQPQPLLWPPPSPLSSHGHPHFSPYPMGIPPPAYIFNNSSMVQSTNSFLNPDAAEWVPSHNDHASLPSDNNILIDDEINFPPLNSTTTNTQPTMNIKDQTEENWDEIDAPSETISTNNNNDNPPATENSSISNQLNSSKIESTITSSSSQNDNTNKPLSSSPTKVTPITYSTVILQTSDNNKSNKNTNNQYQHRQQASTNHVHNQLPPRDRTTKQTPAQQQRTQLPPINFNSRRRQPFNNNNNNNRNFRSFETNSLAKQQQQQQTQISDDWIEVKSKKTKKFDRVITDNSPEKFILDEQLNKSSSPPLSLSSTGNHTTTTTTTTSEDDFDDKDTNDIVIIMDNKITSDYNQIIVDDIHRRLNNNERLLIIMRGCPGSGKSTLAKSLNHGYNGLILSADDYFTDNHLNQYIFDANKLDEAHRYNRRRASDAFKRNISPIIIDNTNTQSWEMKPYVAMGKEADYDILLIEPQTPWRYKARELSKRNLHNLPLRQIKEMLNRFEHNITVQSILGQIPITTKKKTLITSEQEIVHKDTEIVDSIITSKKVYDTIDDSLILNDVRLCINDMILLLTSNYYQTTLLSSISTLTTTTTTSQSSTPLSVSFHDFSLLSSSSTTSSLPSTPPTPHSRHHRPLTRFFSTTSQDHSFNTEHILRLPTATFSRCTDSMNTNHFTPTLPTQSSIIGKKRRKNKTKQEQQSNELLLNTNNNNNNMNNDEENNLQQQQQQQQIFNVFLPEDSSDFLVVDEQNDNDWIDNINRNFGIQINSLREHSSIIPQKQLSNTKNCELINIIHHEFNKPSLPTERHPSRSVKHIAVQCLPNDLINQTDHAYPILIGHLTSTKPIATSSVSLPPGYNECGIQVDLDDNTIDSLIELYSNRLSSETVREFFEVCHSNIQWTRTHIDEHLQHLNERLVIPSLRQLSLDKLNQWNEQIKFTNPLFDTKSIGDLLQDINDDEIFEELSLDDNNNHNPNDVEFIDSNQINIPWSIFNSLQELYGEIPNKSLFSSNTDGVLLPFDDDLSISIYQALQRYLIKSNRIDLSTKPVIESQIKKTNKKKKNNNNNTNNQRWKLPSANQPNIDDDTNPIPSLRQIMNEEQQAAKSQKSNQKRQLDYATEHKLKELERHFPSFDSDLLYDMFRENEYNYDITLICISTMFDENALIAPIPKSQPLSSSRSIPTIKTNVEPVLESYDILRRDALHHAQQRKEFYTKAHQANRHGMSGVASFYIHRAGEQTQLMKDANRAACERLSRWRLAQFHQTQQLDLHGLHSDEALNLFKQIEQELNEGNRRTTPKSIEIITGYGKNSGYAGGHGKIRSVLLTYLQQRNYKYSEPNKGVILLQLTNARN